MKRVGTARSTIRISDQMNRLFVLLFILLAVSNCANKKLSKEENFIADFAASKELDVRRIVYADKLDDYTIGEIEKSMNSDSRLLGESDTIILTKAEKAKIISCLRTQRLDSLGGTSFKNSRMISRDTLGSIFKGADHLKNWTEFNRKYNASLFYFSKPVFFREGTFCAFYWGNSCGPLCGEGEFSIYRKTWRGWKRYVGMYGWIS